MKRRTFMQMFGALAALPVFGKAAAQAPPPVPVHVDHANKTITGVELYSHLMKEWDDPAQRITFDPSVQMPIIEQEPELDGGSFLIRAQDSWEPTIEGPVELRRGPNKRSTDAK